MRSGRAGKRSALTPKQQRFVDEYILDLNATQAAIRAGYSAKTADRIGPELLGKTWVAAAVDNAKQKREKRTEITADRVLEGLAAVAFGDLRTLFSDTGALISPSDLPDAAAKMLAGIEVSTVNRGEGDVEHVAKVKTNDRLKALELLGKHLGMFTDKLEVTGSVELVDRMAEARKRAGRT